MNFSEILDIWALNYLSLVFPTFPVIFAYCALLWGTVLIVILKLNKNKYGKTWADDEVPKSMCISGLIGMAIFIFPIVLGIAAIALAIWGFISFATYALEDK